jgi:penicillin-binding protein 1C
MMLRQLVRSVAWSTAGLSVLLGAALAHYGWLHGNLVDDPPGHVLSDAGGRHLASFASTADGVHGYWPLDTVPSRVAQATLTLEDRRFGVHPGVDPIAVVRAAWQNAWSGRRVSGASTIAMQVARLNRPRARTLWHKLEEMSAALFLTARYGNERVLRRYLEVVPYGNQLRGVSAAARAYLGKPVADLSWAEIAFLAAIPHAPALSNPYSAGGRARARKRAMSALEQLHAQSVVGVSELAIARAQLRRLRVLSKPHRPMGALHAVLAAGRRIKAHRPPTPSVRTTLDLDTQRMASQHLLRVIEEFELNGVEQGAAVVVRLADFSVQAWIGSRGYETGAGSGAIDFVTQPRSPGSTLKPFVYALALERGAIAPDSVVMDAPTPAGFNNADRDFLGPILPRQALANSRNIPAVQVLKAVGNTHAYWMLARLGLHRSERAPQHFGLGLTLGALPVNLEQLITAYGALASDGVLRELKWFDHETPRRQQVLNLSTARLISIFLSDAQARLPSFQRMGNTDFGFPVALKTGTSQGYTDAWTVAWTRTHMVGVWLGRSDARSMHRVSGARAAARVAGDVLRDLNKARSGQSPERFPAPPGYRQYRLCAQSGKTAFSGCSRRVAEWLAVPPAPANFRHAVLDTRNGAHASSRTPAAFARMHTLLRFPPARGAVGGAMRASVKVESARPRIISPTDGARFVLLPGRPATRQSIALRAGYPHAGALVHWYVDGTHFGSSPARDGLRWPLLAGRHHIRAEVEGAPNATTAVSIEVR